MSDHAEHPPINYVKIYWVLLALLIVSIIGPELGNKWITLITAFGIALVKAYMVCAYFMHLKYENSMISKMLITSTALLLLFFIGVAPDVMNKEGDNWKTTIIVEGEKKEESHDHAGHDSHEGHNH